jgi:hypothetical protein
VEPDHKPWVGHALRHHLHASSDGEFAAVVNDYGRHGRMLHLRTGDVTMEVDGGQYHPENRPVLVRLRQRQPARSSPSTEHHGIGLMSPTLPQGLSLRSENSSPNEMGHRHCPSTTSTTSMGLST